MTIFGELTNCIIICTSTYDCKWPSNSKSFQSFTWHCFTCLCDHYDSREKYNNTKTTHMSYRCMYVFVVNGVLNFAMMEKTNMTSCILIHWVMLEYLLSVLVYNSQHLWRIWQGRILNMIPLYYKGVNK